MQATLKCTTVEIEDDGRQRAMLTGSLDGHARTWLTILTPNTDGFWIGQEVRVLIQGEPLSSVEANAARI